MYKWVLSRCRKKYIKQGKKSFNNMNVFFSNFKIAFIKQKQAFMIAFTLFYLDLKYRLKIKINASNHFICEMASKLILDDFSWWSFLTFYFKQKIIIEMRYKSFRSKHLVLVELFKFWWRKVEHCKYEVFVFTDYNNLY